MASVIATKPRLLRAAPSRGAKPIVEREGGDYGAGLIRQAAIVTRGEALGHWMWLDGIFVSTVQKQINASSRGIKARFAHPSLSADGLGTFLGRLKGAAGDEQKTYADLHFSKSSHNTPDGDLASYVMNLATEDSAAFGMS